MRMSESIRKNIFEVSAGGVLNKLKIRRRRSTFFFEEIGSEYVRRCEISGHGKEMMQIGKEWMGMSLEQMLPGSLRKMPPTILINLVIKKLWITSGLMDDFRISKEKDTVAIRTRNEGLTRFMGKNRLMAGVYMGVLESVFNQEAGLIGSMQTRKECEYRFRLAPGKPDHPATKSKSEYDRLNYLKPVRGFTLKYLLEKKIFQLKRNNMIYFRGRSISPIESTLFHIIGNRGILLGDVPDIAYGYFKGIARLGTGKGTGQGSCTKKLFLIKTLLQAMGWGVIKIVVNDNRIIFEIDSPPYGIQAEKDNWDFLARTILGYLWVIDRGFRLSNTQTRQKHLSITYSC